jgi:hypothetical protein
VDVWRGDHRPALLKEMGAISATSVIVVRCRGDSAVEQALRRYASFQLLIVEPALPNSTAGAPDRSPGAMGSVFGWRMPSRSR